MMDAELGRLERVDLRRVWESEPGGFTPWLAREENLRLLGDTIGIELELDSQERTVGPFRADVLCKDTGSGAWVLIENQLEPTDHTHLGQLLTYAAGLNAVTIVWIAERFTDEHRATLDWLNDITDEHFNFFALEIELWQIGSSPIAPKFNIVSKPNEWSQDVRHPPPGDLTETKLLQLEYWTAFRDFLIRRHSTIRSQKPLPQHWANFAIGRAGFLLTALMHTRESRIGCALIMADDSAKAYFTLLRSEQEGIESEVGEELDWRELPERKQSYIMLFRHGADPTDRTKWPEQHAWLAEKLEAFDRTFRQRVKNLRAEEEQAVPTDL